MVGTVARESRAVIQLWPVYLASLLFGMNVVAWWPISKSTSVLWFVAGVICLVIARKTDTYWQTKR